MAVRERDFMNSRATEPEAPEARGWLTRLNEFGERHALAIIVTSTVLVIFTVLVFAKHFYDKARAERAEEELSAAASLESLRGLKDKYLSTPAGPRILYRLANRYYEEGKLESARAEYREFQRRFPGHALIPEVERALKSLEADLAFVERDKEKRLKAARLQTHPHQLAGGKDVPPLWGPVRPSRPVVELDTGSGIVKIELFEDQAPRAVAHVLKLVEEKYWDGASWDVAGDGARLHLLPRTDKPAGDPVPFEDTGRPAEAYSLVLLRKEGAAENLPGQFQILLKAQPDLKGVTVFGTVLEGAPHLSAVKKGDTLKAARRAPPQPDAALKK